MLNQKQIIMCKPILIIRFPSEIKSDVERIFKHFQETDQFKELTNNYIVVPIVESNVDNVKFEVYSIDGATHANYDDIKEMIQKSIDSIKK